MVCLARLSNKAYLGTAYNGCLVTWKREKKKKKKKMMMMMTMNR